MAGGFVPGVERWQMVQSVRVAFLKWFVIAVLGKKLRVIGPVINVAWIGIADWPDLGRGLLNAYKPPKSILSQSHSLNRFPWPYLPHESDSRAGGMSWYLLMHIPLNPCLTPIFTLIMAESQISLLIQLNTQISQFPFYIAWTMWPEMHPPKQATGSSRSQVGFFPSSGFCFFLRSWLF